MDGSQVGMRVCCSNGWAGRLVRLHLHPGTGATHLAIEIGASPDRQVFVPAERVTNIGCEVLFLDLSLAQLQTYSTPPIIWSDEDSGGIVSVGVATEDTPTAPRPWRVSTASTSMNSSGSQNEEATMDELAVHLSVPT